MFDSVLSRALILSAGVITLCASVAAQSRIVVDANNGPGTHFTALPPAIAAAKDGDLVLVRPGRYAPFSTSKALDVVAELGAVIDSGSTSGPLSITDLKVGQRFVLAGFILDFTYIDVARCRGLVTLTGLATNKIDSSRNALYLRECADVVIHGCALKFVQFSRSSVRASDCIFAHSGIASLVGTPGVRLYSSDLSLTASKVVGGDGTGHGAAWAAIIVSPDTGQGSRASNVRVFGDAMTSLVGGVYSGFQQMPAIQDFSAQATLELDPRVSLVGGVQGFTKTTNAKRLSLSVGYSFVGQTANLRLVRSSQQVAAIFVSTHRNKIPLAGLGDWYLEPSLQFVAAAHAFGSNDAFEAHLGLPNAPSLQGLAIGYQAIGIDRGALELSNPVLQVLR
ncbi:MAG: hypothetical protein KDC95_02980 [Planctomycetes bacterium]|nr:hypothetical protein [Planctomycetota bacterium]